MSKIKFSKRQKPNQYTQISNAMLEDTELSFKAKGVLTYMMSRPEGWQFQMTDLINRSKDGKEAVQAGLKELENRGYLHRRQYQNPDTGQFDGWEWVCDDEPFESDWNIRRTEKPTNGKSDENDQKTAEKPFDGKTDRRENRPTEKPVDINKKNYSNKDLNNTYPYHSITGANALSPMIDPNERDFMDELKTTLKLGILDGLPPTTETAMRVAEKAKMDHDVILNAAYKAAESYPSKNALDNRKRSSYFAGIIENRVKAGVLTMEAVEAEQTAHKAQYEKTEQVQRAPQQRRKQAIPIVQNVPSGAVNAAELEELRLLARKLDGKG